MKRPVRIGVVFFVASAIWIFVSDVAVVSLASDLEAMRVAQTLKGWVYVAFATLLVVYLARRELEAARSEAESLRRNERRFQDMVRLAPFPAILHADDGEILALSERWTELTGYEEASLRTVRDWTTRAYGDRRGEVEAVIGELYDADAPRDEGEFRVRTSEGEVRIWDFSSAALGALPDGRRLVLSMAADVTERAEREEALRLSEERYRHLFDRAPLPLWIFDQETLEFLEVNQAAVEKYGYSREEFLGMTIADIRPLDHRTRLVDSVGSEEGLHRAGVWTHLSRDGTPLEVEITAYPVRFRNRRAEFVMATDVATRAMAHEALREGRRTYEQLFRKSHAIMIIVDPDDGSIVDANAAAAEFYGYTVEQLCGMSTSDLNPADPRILAHHVAEASRGRVRFLQFRHRLADGSERDVEIYAAPVELGDRKFNLVMVHDVSDRAEIRRQLEHAQRMEMLGRLAGGVAHDFNNLLTVIRNTAELAGHELESGRDAREDLQVIVEATRRSANLTRQLLAFSRNQANHPEVVEVNLALEEMSGMLDRLLGEHMRIYRDRTDLPTHVWVDHGQLEQVVLNLVLNARDAMPDGGTLKLATRVEPGGAEGEGDQVLLIVEDDGPGVPEDIRQTIFEPFFTTKSEGEGTGLGLSTVFGIVRQARGSVALDPAYSDGARFLVRFPRVPPPQPTESESGAGPPMEAGVTPSSALDPVLIVEDDPAVRAVAERILTKAGYDTITAPSAEEALDIVRSRGVDRVSLVVSDVVMPGMHGPEMVGEMRRIGVRAPVILTSGHRPSPPDASERKRLDPIHYLDKPFAAADLVAAVEQQLHGPA